MQNKVVLITGAARRVGAQIARELHARGACLMLHYRGSAAAALALAGELNHHRPDSVATVQADLLDLAQLPRLVEACIERFGRLDGLVNNASSFFATPLGEITPGHWADLMGSNLQAPLFLAQAAAPHLAATQGAIVGIVDIHADRPLKSFVVYSLAKAGHAQLIRALALELAPQVRVNGVAPGANIWPEGGEHFTAEERSAIEASIPLGRVGAPADLARAVAWLLSPEAAYVTGQVLAVDGGRSVVL
ncbi:MULTISPECIES: pteridine reductase [unclassified Paludibacterium]|uniref:pteridine reductase n=1 Tax=unclassified Paludibacterium TaxID=2618429 RepID=UPI001C0557EB|nr:pteridine reductase [Paludibacterium sp. B53371]BEV72277.1 pteridine reductase [Paludibacterium sp. THUN1379]